MNRPVDRWRNAALWAAYGDALGFITELRDPGSLKKVVSSRHVTVPVAWSRRVGGRFGPTIKLPEGTYSDDTQLRLATSRAIRGDGKFDVEAFAKVELPIWLSYQLGGGRGSKAAAKNLERKDVAWYSNFFDDKSAKYLQAGGNGAAMRIQPHVWSSRDRDRVLLDVLRNAITTHGHPRGFLGAVFHAECLAYALYMEAIPGPEVWRQITAEIGHVVLLLDRDESLARVWLPTWEERSGMLLRDAVRSFQEEQEADIQTVVRLLGSDGPEAVYVTALRDIGALSRESVGSGSKTSLAAALLAYLFREEGAQTALSVAANKLGSDTDSIATMAGSMIGSFETGPPTHLPQDAEYISQEAERMQRLSVGERQSTFRYPDLFRWKLPKASLDVVGRRADQLVVAGLGKATSVSEGVAAPGQDSTEWQWLRLSFGQTILAKRRASLPIADERELAQVQPTQAMTSESKPANSASSRQSAIQEWERVPAVSDRQPTFFDAASEAPTQRVERRRLEDIANEVIESGYDPLVLGMNLKWIIDNSRNPIEMAVAFAAIVARSIGARRR